MTNNIVKKYSLDYENAKADIIAHFSSLDRFSGWDFASPGSALNLVMDILAYNTSQNAFIANRMSSELMLATAQKRSSAVAVGNTLGGYLPQSAQCSRASLTVTINSFGTNGPTEFVTIPKGQQFETEDGFRFYTVQDYITYPTSQSSAVFYDVEIYEGRLMKFTAPGGNNGFIISNKNSDLTTLNIAVDGQKALRLNTEVDIGHLTSETLVYSISETFDGRYKIEFGDGVFGKALSSSETIQVDYIVSEALDIANGYSTFVTESILIYGDITVTTESKSYGGSVRETIDSIKKFAPMNFSSANRAVTTEDYKFLVENNFPYVQSASVWGGEELENKGFGNVYISAVNTNSEFLNTVQKNKIRTFLKSFNIASIAVNFIDPKIINVFPIINIILNPKNINFTTVQAKNIVNAVIENYGVSLRGFSKEYSSSELASLIEESLPGIKFINVDNGIDRTFEIIDGVPISEINFQMPMYHPYDGYGKEKDGIILSSPIIDHQTGIVYYLNDDGYYNIRRYYLDSEKGTKVYVNNTQGTINYATGAIRLDNFSGFGGNADFSIRAIPEEGIIKTTKDTNLALNSQNAIVIIKVNA